MISAYLDYNIYVEIEKGNLALETIVSQTDSKINVIPFSASHIQEVDNITSESNTERERLIAKRLTTIGQVSQRKYIFHELSSNDILLLTEDPETIYETITDVPIGKVFMNQFMNLFTTEQKENVRQSLGIDIKKLNNYTPVQVLEHLNTKLSGWGTQDNLINLLEKSVSMHPNGKTFGLHNRIAGLMEILDMLGYWKDRESDTSNYARLWDSSHIFFASHCNYFISNDRRARQKAKVIYNIYDINTKVINATGDE